ncbi:MAG: hypothetical protein WBY94_12290 [Polyangiaceae bacterium]
MIAAHEGRGGAALGGELTSDGQYRLLGGASDSSLLALDSLPAVVVDGGSDAGPNFDGTYQVIDGSASYGPGTYGLELRPASGDPFLGQIVVTDRHDNCNTSSRTPARRRFTTTYYGQVIVTQNPRAMLLTTFPDTSSYSIFFPLP